MNCNYKWTNHDPNAEKDSDGKKVHPMHVCKTTWHRPGSDHICKCGVTRPKTGK